MTDDRTEFQTDAGAKAPNGPARKWYYQRVMAMMSFAACCLWPVVIMQRPDLDTLTLPWYTLHGGIIMTWFGGSTISAWKR